MHNQRLTPFSCPQADTTGSLAASLWASAATLASVLPTPATLPNVRPQPGRLQAGEKGCRYSSVVRQPTPTREGD